MTIIRGKYNDMMDENHDLSKEKEKQEKNRETALKEKEEIKKDLDEVGKEKEKLQQRIEKLEYKKKKMESMSKFGRKLHELRTFMFNKYILGIELAFLAAMGSYAGIISIAPISTKLSVFIGTAAGTLLTLSYAAISKAYDNNRSNGGTIESLLKTCNEQMKESLILEQILQRSLSLKEEEISKIDSILNSIDDRMKEIQTYFDERREEYEKQKSEIYRKMMLEKYGDTPTVVPEGTKVKKIGKK